MDSESKHKATLQLFKEKLLVRKYVIEGQPDADQDQIELFNIDAQIGQNDLDIKTISNTMSSLQEQQDFLNTKISEVSQRATQTNMEFVAGLSKQNLSSAEGVKTLIDCFFSVLQEASGELR